MLQIWKTQQWPQDWKRSVFIPIPKKGNAKECSNYRAIALISHTSKVMLKILQDSLQQYVNCEKKNPELIYKTETDSQTENKLIITRVGRGGKQICTTIYKIGKQQESTV